jgi:hypothetical protein
LHRLASEANDILYNGEAAAILAVVLAICKLRKNIATRTIVEAQQREKSSPSPSGFFHEWDGKTRLPIGTTAGSFANSESG